MRLSAPSSSGFALGFSVFVCCIGLGSACSDNVSDSPRVHKDGGSQDDGGDADGGAASTGDGGGPGFTSALSIIVEPSDDGTALLNAIKGAKKSIHMTMYILSDHDTIDALVAQQQTGTVDVKVVLNEAFPSGQGNSNSDAYATLHGVDPNGVVYASTSFTYTHEKCIIIDGTTAWIMTMNESNSAPTSNREYLAVDSDPDDVAEADAIFQADFAHAPITPNGNLLVAPENDKARIRALMGTATNSIDVEVEELSDFDVVDDLANIADSGVKVRIVLSDITPTNAQNAATTKLKSHSNVSMVTTHDPYIHAKAIIVDGARMYVGSANLTDNSLDNNRELGLVTQTADVISPVQTAIDTDFPAGTAL